MRQCAVEHKERLCRDYLAALDQLDAEHREPDRWEEECLAYALGAMACGLYLVANVELEAFRRPLAERPAEVLAKLAARPRRFNTAMLRQGLDYVRQHYGEPLEPGSGAPAAVIAGQHQVQSSLGSSG